MAKALGRGLEALLGEDISSMIEEDQKTLRELRIEDIDPNRSQPRRHFDKEELSQLASSIMNHGVLQPILVVRQGERYMIIAGERRWRAAREAGLSTIPAIERDLDNVTRMEIALIENLQREDLNPIDQAVAIRALMDECGLNHEGVAKRLGKSRSAITNTLRLMQLDDEVQQLVVEKKLSAGHARALSALHEKETQQKELAAQAVAKNWSVRQLEQEVSRALHPQKEERVEDRIERIAELAQLEEMSREAFGLRSRAQGSLDKGSLTIHYASTEELNSLYEALEYLQRKG